MVLTNLSDVTFNTYCGSRYRITYKHGSFKYSCHGKRQKSKQQIKSYKEFYHTVNIYLFRFSTVQQRRGRQVRVTTIDLQITHIRIFSIQILKRSVNKSIVQVTCGV